MAIGMLQAANEQRLRLSYCFLFAESLRCCDLNKE